MQIQVGPNKEGLESLIFRCRELDSFNTLESLTESGLEYFSNVLVEFLLGTSPCPIVRIAGGADQSKSIIWFRSPDESIRTALIAV